LSGTLDSRLALGIDTAAEFRIEADVGAFAAIKKFQVLDVACVWKHVLQE
jgi:hypothetical protein